MPHYERAAALEPDSAVIHNNLGGALAATGRSPKRCATCSAPCRSIPVRPGAGQSQADTDDQSMIVNEAMGQ